MGVIPRFMMDREWNHPDIGETVVTESMHARKQVMIDRAQAFVSLPGGTGTLEEITECLSFKRLGLHNDPVALANWDGFYDPFIEQLDRTITGGFLAEGFRGMFESFADLEGMLRSAAISALRRDSHANSVTRADLLSSTPERLQP